MLFQNFTRTALAAIALVCAACSGAITPTVPATQAASRADLNGIKTYLSAKLRDLKSSSEALALAGDRYYQLAHESNFDYARLWKDQAQETAQTLQAARAAWQAASPLYEQVEGIVGGVPELSQYDLILDAGASVEQDPENAVPFDLNLPDGRVLPKPGNLFGVLESALWGTYKPFIIPAVQADLDGNGKIEFGEVLPDANVLKAAADLLDSYVSDLLAAGQAWQPNETDAFTALVVMVPTMSELFESWKNSRFVLGDASTQRDFAVISRLSDIQDILSSIQVIYAGLKPLVQSVDDAQAEQIERGLNDLKSFTLDLYQQEEAGKRFTPQDADLLGREAQDRASAIAGQISQVALFAPSSPGLAAADSPTQTAESIRLALFNAQLDLETDPPSAKALLSQARSAYRGSFGGEIAAADAVADAAVQDGFARMQASVRREALS